MLNIRSVPDMNNKPNRKLPSNNEISKALYIS